jgi:hypothetical protein
MTRHDTRPQGSLKHLVMPFASGMHASPPPRVLLVLTTSSVLPLPFPSFLLALRRTTTSLWYVPRARRYTGASSFLRSTSLSGMWSPYVSHSSPPLRRLLSYIAPHDMLLSSCFIMIRATDHRLIMVPLYFASIFPRSSSYLADHARPPRHCMFVVQCSLSVTTWVRTARF